MFIRISLRVPIYDSTQFTSDLFKHSSQQIPFGIPFITVQDTRVCKTISVNVLVWKILPAFLFKLSIFRCKEHKKILYIYLHNLYFYLMLIYNMQSMIIHHMLHLSLFRSKLYVDIIDIRVDGR